ncbi:MAG: hydrogenase maturation nickel metallochaperone HypA [Dehalococcoidales bacterium]|nr:hydrogenase maturation nickel metallochaperone HypA [Dehalococcoidales bacterium]
MHELAITQSMFEIVLKHAEQAQAKKVTKINLVIGEMTGVVSESVQFYLDFLTRGTIAEGASVSLLMVKPRAQCCTCKQAFEISEFDWTCPNCKGNSIEIIAGKELFVESIEVD